MFVFLRSMSVLTAPVGYAVRNHISVGSAVMRQLLSIVIRCAPHTTSASFVSKRSLSTTPVTLST